MQFYFNPADLQTISHLRRVTTITADDARTTSENKLLVLYSIDHTGSTNVLRLVNGSAVGIQVANVVSSDNLPGLPMVNSLAGHVELKTTYKLTYDIEVAKTQKIYQLFVGDMYASDSSMTTFHSNADAVLETLANARKLTPKAPHAYCIKYEYGKESIYLPLIESS